MKTIRKLLTLGAIIGAMPNQIANGQANDAAPVMANFNWILAQVNANAAPLTALPAVTGITPFTPRLAINASSAGITYNFRVGAYFKIANGVYFTLDILLTSKGASVGAVTIEDLPFTIGPGFPVGGVSLASIATRNVGIPDGLMAITNSGTTRLNIWTLFNAGPAGLLSNAELANNSEIIITGFYST